MEKHFDPNVPDESDGDYFCRLCLIHANSENIWKIHIAGKRHIKNVMKFPKGIPKRQDDNDYDSFEKPAKYGRYENDKWNDCSSEDYGNRYYTQRNYVPEIRPQVIDYGHKKCLPDVISSPVSETPNAATGKVNHKDRIDKIFGDEKFDQLKKLFQEQISKTRACGMQQNSWNSNKEKPHKEESSFGDDFEKELDELLKTNPDNSDSDKDTFSNKFKRKFDDLFSGKSSNRETRDKNLEIPTIVDSVKDSHKKSNKTKIPDDSISVKRRDDKDKIKTDRNSYKKKSNMKDDVDFVDIFHKMNDQKLFEIVDEDEDNSSVKKSSKTEYSKLDDFDPDELTPDGVDNLLSSYLKPKSEPSKSQESAEYCTKNSAEASTKDDIDSFARKLESLPTKTFFEIILGKLKKLDLKDSDELQMLLGVISQAQEVVCKKLPPHLQAVIKSKLSQNNTKTTPVSVQNSILDQSNSVPTTRPIVSQAVSQPVLPTTSCPSLKSNPQSLSRKEVKSVPEPVSHISSQPVQTPVSNTAPSVKSPVSSNSDSFQSMIAWQKYLTSMEAASEKHALKSSNSVQSTIAYQNYLSSLQAKAVEASKSFPKTTPKTTSENTGSLSFCSKSKASLSSSPNCTQATTQAVSVSASRKSLSTSKSDNAKDTLQKYFSTLQAAVSNTTSQTPSSSLTKSALPCTSDSSQNQSALKNDKNVSQTNGQTVSSSAEISSSNVSHLNQATLLNYQTYYQQMHALHLQRMSGPYANVPSASLATSSSNLAVSQPNSSVPSYSWYNGFK